MNSLKVFRLHYKATFIILVVASLLVTSRQYIGDPIDCIVEEIPNNVSVFNHWCLDLLKVPKCFCAGPNILSHSKNLITFMPFPFTGPKMFCVSPNVLGHSKNLIAFSASSKSFVPAQKPILLNANRLLFWHKMFVTGTLCKYIFCTTKKIGLAQNI